MPWVGKLGILLLSKGYEWEYSCKENYLAGGTGTGTTSWLFIMELSFADCIHKEKGFRKGSSWA